MTQPNELITALANRGIGLTLQADGGLKIAGASKLSELELSTLKSHRHKLTGYLQSLARDNGNFSLTPMDETDKDAMADRMPPGYYGWSERRQAWIEITARPPTCRETLTVPGAPIPPVTTTRADLLALHPAKISGIPLVDILDHAEPADMDALRDIETLKTFAKSLAFTGALNLESG